MSPLSHDQHVDTAVVPARDDAFRTLFLGQRCWGGIHIDQSMLARIKYVAVYRVAPVSAVTHWAPVKSIERRGHKYFLLLAEGPCEFGPVRRAVHGRVNGLQSLRYANLAQLTQAATLDDIW